MSYIVRPKGKDGDKIVVQTRESQGSRPGDWWNSNDKKELCDKMLANVGFLKELSQQNYRKASYYAQMYGNMPIFSFAGDRFGKVDTTRLPADRPTMSVITSCVDTIVSRLGMNKPRPLFLTDNGNYRERKVAKEMNQFIAGEFYQTRAYPLGELTLRDAAVLGTGCLKVLEDQYKRVALERRLYTELLVDPNDAFYGFPRQIYELKLIERSVLMQTFPKYVDLISDAEEAFVSNSGDAQRSVSDLVLVAEGWHLKSGPDAKDGVHAICCSSGTIFDEEYDKKNFPFVFLHYAPGMAGFWGQGIAERQFGSQMEINKLLVTTTNSINVVGVPRVFVEEGSKIGKAILNNAVGAIVPYRGTKPIFEVAPCVAPEIYQQLQRIIQYAYEQEGISQLSASSQKPAGLNSGEAIRTYNDVQQSRFAALEKRYNDFYTELAYQIIDKARDIAKRDGKYETVFPDKNGTKQIDLPASKLLDDPFVIQCYDTSSLPRDPSGRLEKVSEMMQIGVISPSEGRRLLDYPDIDQVDKLANAGEERILQILDEIVDNGKYTPPDPFMDIQLASQLVVQYYNLYANAKLEEKKKEQLRTWKAQCDDLLKAALPPPPMMTQIGAPPLQQNIDPNSVQQSGPGQTIPAIA